MNEEEAKKALSERQTTFTLAKCILKYGEETGKQRWSDRQAKWMKNFPKSNFSKISQTLFWSIYETIKIEPYTIYFAELNNGEKDSSGKNYEFSFSSNGIAAKFDFYLKDFKKIIEFDGDYWHGPKRGNQERDALRNIKLEELGFDVYHVLEREYKSNPSQVINQCLNFLKSPNKSSENSSDLSVSLIGK